MPEAILVLNAGSSSIKFSVYALGAADRLSLDSKGQVEGIGSRPRFVAGSIGPSGYLRLSYALGDGVPRRPPATPRDLLD